MPSIYKTPDGAVFKNPNGKTIKTPFYFGNAFQNRMELNNYLKIDGLDIAMFPSTEIIWIHDVNATLEENILTRKTNDNNNYNILSFANQEVLCRNSESGSVYEFVLGVNLGFIQSSINMVASILESSVSGYSYCNSICTKKQTPNYINANINTCAILIGAIKKNTSTDIMPLRFSKNKYNRYSLFSRAFTESELNYFNNNLLGNEFQSTLNIEIDLTLNHAEILDFSPLQNGSDMRVGCRDYSGYNRHGEIMNLPAGTLQQKLDFANANLFVPFQ